MNSQTLQDLTKQIGIDYTAVEAEGERLWNTLNELSNNPEAYADFMAQQMQHLHVTDGPQVPPFVPFHAFTVEAFQSNGKTLFINICHHDSALPKPMRSNRNTVANDSSRECLESLQIPLLVSSLRYCTIDGTASDVVDVVVHSWCIEACRTQSLSDFTEQLVELAVETVKEEHSMKLQSSGSLTRKQINAYTGGLGDGTAVRPFQHNQPRHEKNTVGDANQMIAESPLELLKCRKGLHQRESNKSRSINLSQTSKAKSNQHATTPLVQELSPAQNNSAETKRESLMKAGFLNKGKKALYSGDGSTGDGSSGKGGAYSKLLSKCKVVDLHAPSAKQGEVKSEEGDSVRRQDVIISTKDNQVQVTIDLSSCLPSIDSISKLDLQVAENGLVLYAPSYHKQWRVDISKPVEVSTISAKFRRKDQVLDIVCIQK